MRLSGLASFFVIVLIGGCARSLAQAPKPALTAMVPMRDGVRLATDVYLPADGKGRWPALLVRTPYNKNGYGPEFGSWAARGYAMIVQDMRGRFASEGVDLAFLDCGDGPRKDGLDTVNWIAAQPWCDGKVGTLGASAMGITQNMLAAVEAAPDALVAQYIIVAAGSLYHQAAYWGGASRLEAVMGYVLFNVFHPDNVWLDVLHPMYDRHWQRLDSIAVIDHARVPAVFYGGWYDVFLAGTLETFLARQQRGGPGARGQAHLVIGPWCHGGPGTDAKPKRTGEFLFPANSRKLPCPLSGVEWFDHYLKGQDNGADRAPAVVYYTMGAVDEPGAPGNVWRMEPSWPPTAEMTVWYLHADGTLGPAKPADARAVGGGVTAATPRTFIADPHDPVPTHGGANLNLAQGSFDQRDVESRPDVLVFTSAPLDAPTEVTGPITATLHVASDGPDADFAVKLCDLYPDGRSMIVCDGILRARHRKGVDRIDPLTPGEVTTLTVDLTATSLVFNRGHRVRVSVAGSNYPRFDVNPNTGWPAWPFSPQRVAHNTLHCSPAHPSAITLPIRHRPAS
ncbi:MAG: CocE/NonD family hydrolase [Planctomycetes bacterium]|nr:CocE/NonD family hydrolase [Planctomycetota bacterium]